MKFMYKKKKFFATALTATAIAAAVVVPSASADSSGYSDVSPTYTDAVYFLVENGITQGTAANTFGTDSPIKRSDAAIFIARAIGLNQNIDYKDAGFKDVPQRARWAVNALVEKNVLNGLSSTKFGSDELLTRNQMAKIIANAGNLDVDMSAKSTRFTDVNSNFAPFVEALTKENITKGKSKTNFGADDSVTRGEMALFINRAQQHFGFMDLLVMHLNDTHAYLDNFPYIATAVKELRSKSKNNLLLHAGDVFSGDLYFNAFQGKADLALMNNIGFDAMTFGNHEFDLGSTEDGHKALSEFTKNAQFPLLAANIDFSKDALFNGMQTKEVAATYKDGHIYDGVVLNVNGHKVGVFGLTTEETPAISSTEEIEFTNYITEAKKSVKAFEDMGVDKIIALTHIGYDDSLKFDNDLELAKLVEGIDIIVGGHTHSALKEPKVVLNFEAPTVIVQANEYGKLLGTLDVKFNQNGYITYVAGELIPTDSTSELKLDLETSEILAPFAAGVLEMREESIGKSTLTALDGRRASDDDGVSSVRYNETNLGNLMTDAMLAKAKEIEPRTSIALQNGGGIRATIPSGDITIGNVLKAMPFGNALALAEISGADLKAILEHGVSADERDGGGLKENGAFLHVAGLQFTYDSKAKTGERIKTVKVKQGSDYINLVNSEIYYVATNNFTAKGGDGFEEFALAYKEGRVTEPGFVDYENFIEYVKTLETVEPKVEGRIIDIALQK